MNDLVEAFQIFAKYTTSEYPTDCSNEELFVNVSPSIVLPEDVARLQELSFFQKGEGFASFRFGGC
jgi:hypothetical protein